MPAPEVNLGVSISPILQAEYDANASFLRPAFDESRRSFRGTLSGEREVYCGKKELPRIQDPRR